MITTTRKPVWVSGLARSGTSIVSRICHQMGICMGVTMVAPVMGLDFEYEEPELAMGGKVTKGYIKRRQREGYEYWGAKTPRLLEQWDKLDGYRIITRRPIDDVTASVRRVFGEGSYMEQFNQRWGEVDSDLVIDFGTDPKEIAQMIGGLVGIDYDEGLAVEGIRIYNS